MNFQLSSQSLSPVSIRLIFIDLTNMANLGPEEDSTLTRRLVLKQASAFASNANEILALEAVKKAPVVNNCLRESRYDVIRH